MFSMKPSAETSNGRVIRVGILGCGMVTQVVHIPTLNNLSHLFQITHLFDVSESAMRHSQLKVAGGLSPKITGRFEDICTAPEVDLVLIATHEAFHASQAVIALQAQKHVFIEKPIALTLQDVDLVIEADKAAGGDKAFVGYMRRYAAAFEDVVKEMDTLGNVLHARVRDIIGPNHVFSGSYPRTFDDYHNEDPEALRIKSNGDMKQALQAELGVPLTKQTEMTWHLLSVLGSHDLSAMREILGMPTGVLAFSPPAADPPFWSALLQYPNFVVAYESGLDQVPRFDASIEIFGERKTVKLCIDTPFVKGLATTMVVKESMPDGSYRESTTRRTYEDPFILEFKAVYRWVVEGAIPKTNPADARHDLEILGMLMKAAK